MLTMRSCRYAVERFGMRTIRERVIYVMLGYAGSNVWVVDATIHLRAVVRAHVCTVIHVLCCFLCVVFYFCMLCLVYAVCGMLCAICRVLCLIYCVLYVAYHVPYVVLCMLFDVVHVMLGA